MTNENQKNPEKEIDIKLARLSNTIDVARSCGFQLTGSHSKYVEARSLLNAGNISEADDKAWETHNEIHNELETAAYWNIGPLKIWTLRYAIFKGKTYGIFSLIYTCIVLLFFIGFLFNYTSTTIDKDFISFWVFKLPSTIIGIPLWAALLGGIGACAQIFHGLIDDVYYYGIVRDENHFRYVILPLMSPIFGYIAYILMDLGVVALGGSKSETTLSAGDVLIEGRVIICFLAGFATSNFLKKISEVTEYLFGNKDDPSR
jgi:hypothetical protein